MSLDELDIKIKNLKHHYLSIKDEINLNLQKEVIEHIVLKLITVIRDYNMKDCVIEYEYPLAKANHHGGTPKAIDIALVHKNNNKPSVLIEVKRLKHGNQKNRLKYPHNRIEQVHEYFRLSNPKPFYVLLTNGEDYWFYSNMKKPRTLDKDPFLKFNIVDYSQSDLEKLYRILTCSNKKQLKKSFDEVPYYNMLRTIRKSKNITARQLADKLYVSEAWITSIERGEHVPQLNTATIIANVLNCTILDLFPPKLSKEM